jgi:hypothetical protein
MLPNDRDSVSDRGLIGRIFFFFIIKADLPLSPRRQSDVVSRKKQGGMMREKWLGVGQIELVS